MTRFRGTFTAIVTPFRPDGGVDVDALRRFVEWQITSGVDGLVPCGTTGEGATLLPDEHALVVRTTVESAARRVPVVAGCGTNDTRTTIAGARRAVEAGADALLVVSPYYNKPNRSGMIAHYRAVAEAAGVPLIPYNVPGRTGQNLPPDWIFEIAAIPGIAGVKEAAANLEQVADLVAGRPSGFAILSGDDSLALASAALGIDGVISVVANEAPAETSAMMRAALAGEFEKARALHYRLLPLMRANFVESNPVPVKAACAMLGRCAETARAPLGPPSEATRRTLRAALEAAGLLSEVK